jgi:hypothetical protein
MTLEEYERLYAEALEVVRHQFGKMVDHPKHRPDGIRFVHINGKSCHDETVFTEAWGKETARDIVDQRRAGW